VNVCLLSGLVFQKDLQRMPNDTRGDHCKSRISLYALCMYMPYGPPIPLVQSTLSGCVTRKANCSPLAHIRRFDKWSSSSHRRSYVRPSTLSALHIHIHHLYILLLAPPRSNISWWPSKGARQLTFRTTGPASWRVLWSIWDLSIGHRRRWVRDWMIQDLQNVCLQEEVVTGSMNGLWHIAQTWNISYWTRRDDLVERSCSPSLGWLRRHSRIQPHSFCWYSE
jgi:hypothetical protein